MVSLLDCSLGYTKNFFPLLLVSILAGCGNSSVDNEPGTVMPGSDVSTNLTEPSETNPEVIRTGVFIDSPIANIDYRTESLSGTTSVNGEFKYRSGETVTFAIGDLALPTIPAAAIVTPLDMAEDERIDDTVTNIIRLLQSLDVDGNPENGITISEYAKLNATQVIFAQSVASFANSTAVTALLPNAGLDVVMIGLIPVIHAISHLEQQLALLQPSQGTLPATELSSDPSSTWILEPDAENKLTSSVLVSFTGPSTLLVTRYCEIDGQMNDLLLQGTYSYNQSNGVISTFIVRSADQVCDDNLDTPFSTRRLKWLNGRLFGYSLEAADFAFTQ